MSKLPNRFTPYVFAFFMALIMAALMSSVIVAVQAGVGPDYWTHVLRAYALAMPLAFCCVVVVRPLVVRLVSLTVQH